MSGRIFLFVAVAIMASFDVHGHAVIGAKPVRYEPEAPRRCCFPKQVSAMMTLLNTVNSDKITVLDMQMDYDKQQQVMVNYTGPGEPRNKVLIDYGNAKLYSWSTKDNTTCFKMNFTMPMRRCIPDDAKYLGSSYLGPMGAGQLPYDAWKMKLKEYSSTLAVTKEGCVPIVEGLSSPYEDTQLYFYSGYQPKLTDPSAFNLPKSCTQ